MPVGVRSPYKRGVSSVDVEGKVPGAWIAAPRQRMVSTIRRIDAGSLAVARTQTCRLLMHLAQSLNRPRSGP